MKKIRLILTLSLLLSCCIFVQVHAQVKKITNTYAYSAIIQSLKPIASGSRTYEQQRDLAHAYFKTNQAEEASAEYATLTSSFADKATTHDWMHYALSLRLNGKYAESDNLLQKIEYRKNVNVAKQATIKAPFKTTGFEIRKLNNQGDYAEYGLVPLNKGAALISANKEFGLYQNTYSWHNTPFYKIYYADVTDTAMQGIKPLSNLNTKSNEYISYVSADGKKVLYTTNRKKANASRERVMEVWTATFDAENKKLSGKRKLNINHADYSVAHAVLTEDGKYIIFSAEKPEGYGQSDLYIGEYFSNDSVGTVYNMGDAINTPARETFPYVHNGQLYFASDGHKGKGGLDIYRVFHFTSDHIRNREFTAPVNIGDGLNTNYDDFFIRYTSETTGFFSSNRATGKANDDIFTFVEQRVYLKKISGNVLDKITGTKIPGAPVKLTTETGEEVACVADNNGYYELEWYSNKPQEKQTLGAPDYQHYTGVAVPVITSQKNTSQDLYLTPSSGTFTVMAKNSKSLPVPGALITLKNVKTGAVVTSRTNENGVSVFPLDAKIGETVNYEVVGEKENHFKSSLQYNAKVTQKMEKTITLDAIELGTDIGKALNLNPIYFDLSKWNIRKDAAKELDKIVAILKEYPNIVIELGSHTDSRGNDKSNQTLSEKRAKSSRDYIIAKGIAQDRVAYKGYGESVPMNKCINGVKCTEPEYALNRRTEFKIVKM